MMDEEKIAVKVQDIVKSFKIPLEASSGLKQKLVNFIKGRKGYREFTPLNNVSFEIEKGDFFGIVGRNGSGKSTLLKTIAGIYAPDSGLIKVNGTLVPFIELGVGFNPELTGRENVFLNGALLGFSRAEVEKMYEGIVEFAELDDFMDERLKNYSSGMQVRLAFSIAIRADGDILLLDEVLAVGDEAFQKKCFSYFAELKKNKKTVILVTHSMDSVQQFCNKAMLIDKGHKTEIGTPLEISQLYRELNNEDNVTVNASQDKQKTETKHIGVGVEYRKLGDELEFDIKLSPKTPVDDPLIALGVYHDTGEQVYRWTSDEKVPFVIDLKEHNTFKIRIKDVFPVGFFTVNLYIKKRDRTMDYAVFNDIVKFEIKNQTPYQYATFWKIPEHTFVNDEEVNNVHR